MKKEENILDKYYNGEIDESQLFKDLIDKYHDLLYQFGSRWVQGDKELLNDAILDTFVRFHRLITTGKQKNIHRIPGYLSGYLRNTIKDQLREKSRNKIVPINPYEIELFESPEALADTMGVEKEDAIKHQKLSEIIKNLNEGEQVLLRLYMMEGFTAKEIAVHLNTTESYVYKNINGIRNKLQKLMRDNKIIDGGSK